MMLSRTTRILLVVALVAVGVYFVAGRFTREPSPDDSSKLIDFDIARVDGLILQRMNETLRFTRSDSLWRMTAPLSDQADLNAIVPLLDALEHADIARNLGHADDLSPFGLDRPLVVIVAMAGADTLLDLTVGNRTVDEAWCYARTRSRDLLLVPTNIARGAALPRDAYRDQRVVGIQLRDVSAYDVRTDGRSMSWVRGGRGWFSVVAGDTIAGDSVAVETVLRRLRGLRVASFASAPCADDSRPHRSLHIDVWGANRTSLAELDFSCGPDSQCCVTEKRRGGYAIMLNDGVDDLFAHTTTGLRDRRLLQFSPPDALRIEIASAEVSGAIVRAGGAWSFPNPALGRVDPERAAEFVRALRALKWTDVAPGAARGSDESRFTITVTDASGNILDEMRANPHSGNLWYVTSRSSRVARVISREHLTALAEQFSALKAP